MIGTVKPVAVYNPLPWQIAPWRDKSKIMLLTGSAGGGKSRVAAEKVHAYCKKYPGAMGLMVRKTRTSMTNSTVLFMDRAVIGRDTQVTHVSSKNRFDYANNSILAYGGMADEEQREQIRSIGQDGAVDIIWVEEANKITEDDYNELLARLRGKAAPWRQMILSTNPDAPIHWIKRRLMDGGEASVYYSRATDNPYNPADYIDTLRSLTGVLEKRLNQGLWIQAEGAVYENFSDELHVIDPFLIPADWTRIRSIDFGYTNPFVCQWWAIDPDGRMYLYREIYETQKLVEDHAAEIVRLSQGERIKATVADHDAEDRATLERRGIKTIPALKEIMPGIQAVTQRLRKAGDGRPRLFIMRGCTVSEDQGLASRKLPVSTLEEFPAYIWPEAKDGKPIKEVPVDLNNHGCLVGNMVITTSIGPKPLNLIEPGDYVLGRDGFKLVEWSALTNKAACIKRVLLANGAILDGTADHPVYTENRGYIYIDTLRYGDMVWYNTPEKESLLCYQNLTEKEKPKSSFTRILNLGVIQNLRRLATKLITCQGTLNARRALIDYIVNCTRTLLGLSLMDTKCITRMAIALTTQSTILNLCPTQNIRSTTRLLIPKHSVIAGENGLCKRFSLGLPIGTNQKRGESGTGSTQRKRSNLNQDSIPVSNAERSLNQENPQRELSIAQINAGQPQGAQEGTTMRLEYVSDVGQNLLPTNTASSDIAPVPVAAVFDIQEIAPVYNLKVEGGEYFANGILVHNCDAARYAVMDIDGPPKWRVMDFLKV